MFPGWSWVVAGDAECCFCLDGVLSAVAVSICSGCGCGFDVGCELLLWVLLWSWVSDELLGVSVVVESSCEGVCCDMLCEIGGGSPLPPDIVCSPLDVLCCLYSSAESLGQRPPHLY